MRIEDGQPIDDASIEPSVAPLAGATMLRLPRAGSGLSWSIVPGTLHPDQWLGCDLLLEGDTLAVLAVDFISHDPPAKARLSFGLLSRCQARLRFPLAFTDQRQWMLGREGALLKRLMWGDRVDLARVDEVRFTLDRAGSDPVLLHVTGWRIDAVEPVQLSDPALPDGPLLDDLGQSQHRNWPTKTRSFDDLRERLHAQLAGAAMSGTSQDRTRWGGDATRRLAPATGFFARHFDGKRWWLVDPDGCAFFSAGPDCVGPSVQAAVEHLGLAAGVSADDPTIAPHINPHPSAGRFINSLARNFHSVFGDDWRSAWERITLSLLRRWQMNTIGNWSDWQFAQRVGFPYVRPLHERFERSPKLFRDFPDVFDPRFEQDAIDYAQQLLPTRDDPAMLGYFLMNEPTWGFAPMSVAEGMLFAPSTGTHGRAALIDWIGHRYATNAALAASWQMPDVSLESLDQPWTRPLSQRARRDLEQFSTLMVDRLFSTLTRACRSVDPNHLNLGARYYTIPPTWAQRGMTSFDVFSVNQYRKTIDPALGDLSDKIGAPVLVGEWHFGALDAGLPATGIGHVPTQADRGRAYRVYLENAAAQPWCVGAHWFTLYDQSAIGRFDGENYNIGLLDVCNRAYDDLCDAARASHERMYDIAAGKVDPLDDAPEHRPMLFM